MLKGVFCVCMLRVIGNSGIWLEEFNGTEGMVLKGVIGSRPRIAVSVGRCESGAYPTACGQTETESMWPDPHQGGRQVRRTCESFLRAGPCRRTNHEGFCSPKRRPSLEARTGQDGDGGRPVGIVRLRRTQRQYNVEDLCWRVYAPIGQCRPSCSQVEKSSGWRQETAWILGAPARIPVGGY